MTGPSKSNAHVPAPGWRSDSIRKAIESDLKDFKKKLCDMRDNIQQLVDRGEDLVNTWGLQSTR